MELIIYLACCYLNFKRAEAAKLNGFKWALLTFVIIFLFVGIGSFLLLASFVSQDAGFRELASNPEQDPKLVMEAIQKKVTFLHQLFVLFCGLGGYLLVRYWITKRTNKNELQSFS